MEAGPWRLTALVVEGVVPFVLVEVSSEDSAVGVENAVALAILKAHVSRISADHIATAHPAADWKFRTGPRRAIFPGGLTGPRRASFP
jgi:hypothetical protein